MVLCLGEDGYLALLSFYRMIREMFVNGNVGGTVITMVKPKGWFNSGVQSTQHNTNKLI